MIGYLVTVVGLICFFEGLPYLAVPAHLKKILHWVIATRTNHLRLMGCGLMVMGLLLVYWGRTHGG